MSMGDAIWDTCHMFCSLAGSLAGCSKAAAPQVVCGEKNQEGASSSRMDAEGVPRTIQERYGTHVHPVEFQQGSCLPNNGLDLLRVDLYTPITFTCYIWITTNMADLF